MITKNQKKILEFFDKNKEHAVNVNQIARLLNISVGSAHKIMQELKSQKVLIAKKLGNSIVYKLNQMHPSKDAMFSELKTLNDKNNFKKTKIIGTIGPACADPLIIKQMLNEGMNVARINGSHGDFEDHEKAIKLIRTASQDVPILIDMPGSKIRLGDLPQDLEIKKGEEISFIDIDFKDNFKEALPVNYTNIHKILKPTNKIMIDDGNLGFKVKEIKNKLIICEVLNDGVIKSRKGFHMPDLQLEYEELTKKDLEFINFAIKNDLDFIGVSFTNNRGHITKINNAIGEDNLKVIAKIETQRGVDNYKEIIEESYGIMIDRGDLGGETSPETIPKVQKKIINECNNQGKPIIIATQLLDSMIENSVPKKSEVSDIANAVLDGARALMLSAETAVGAYPLETIRVLTRVISTVEDEADFNGIEEGIKIRNLTDSITRSIKQIVNEGDVDKIISLTSGGYSARMIARYKPKAPIIAITHDKKVQRQIKLLWGVFPVLITEKLDNSVSTNQKSMAINLCLKQELISLDDTILINGAVFPNHRKMTNLIEVHNVKEVLNFFAEENKND
ncbi:pyruvate kinase [Candidatus Woesearchaeota archaeon]|nr:pyruvate kinase [Candidatus Woesearchaeota archaeon]